MTNDRNSFRIETVTTRIVILSVTVNLVLACLKLMAGIMASSGALMADAVHSVADVFSVFIAVIGIRMASHSPDEKHPYGHERMECVAAILLAMLLGVTGGVMGCRGMMKSICIQDTDGMLPGIEALLASMTVIFVKEILYWYIRKIAKRVNSGALMAEAWHHRTDALASLGGFVGIFGARLGVAVMEPLASVVISCFIIKAAIDIFLDAIRKMLDVSCDGGTIKQVFQIAAMQKQVIGVESVKTRIFGDKKYVDVVVLMDKRKSLEETHEIAERIHKEIEEMVADVKHCMVSVLPAEEEDETWQR